MGRRARGRIWLQRQIWADARRLRLRPLRQSLAAEAREQADQQRDDKGYEPQHRRLRPRSDHPSSTRYNQAAMRTTIATIAASATRTKFTTRAAVTKLVELLCCMVDGSSGSPVNSFSPSPMARGATA